MTLPSLRAYVLLSQTEMMICQGKNGRCYHDVFSGGDIKVELPLGDVHKSLQLDMSRIDKFAANSI